MTDDMIRSMKSQMTPSDDVVNDLLAKIAALEASPENMENVVSFDESRFARPEIKVEKPSKAKTTKKSIWFYGTAAAASALVLLSTFAMFGDDADIGEQFDDIIDQPGIVTDITQVGENTPDPVNLPPVNDTDNTDEPDTADQQDPVKQENNDDKSGKTVENNNDTEKDPVKQEDDNQDKAPEKEADSDNKQDNSQDAEENPSDSNENQTALVTPPPAGNEDSENDTISVDDSKVTPGAPGESAISWQREILAESSVSNITVQGTNYVVESVASSPSVASTEVQKISLEIPATSTTNHTTVEAKVKTVKNVSKELMIAVDAEGFKETLLYTNVDYKPETLGQYISDAGLSSSNTTFVKATTSQRKGIGKTDTKKINVADIDALVKQYILSNADAPSAKYGQYNSAKVHVLFRTSSNPTQTVINFGVSDNGYLYVKLSSGNSFTFHIGEENAKSFISHITGE